MTMKLLDHWSAPAGAGAPIACLATTFTFDSQFFTDDCLSRFLALTAVTGEGDKAGSIAAIIEEEIRLSETTAISVLVDRGTPAEKRNLRWDLIPIPVRRGLLHAKSIILLWENHARIVVGSANLTKAGYRSQLESAVAFDVLDGCGVPRDFLLDIVGEIESFLVSLPTDASEASRARTTLTMMRDRILVHAPERGSSDLRFAAAPASPGRSPIGVHSAVWGSTLKPVRAVVLAPFWDAQSSHAIDEVRKQLTGRPASARSITAVIGQDRIGNWLAPAELADRVDDVRALKVDDSEQRTLHAKVLLLENDDWVAAMIGSSNATSAGWGLSPATGHRELNVWVGAARGSKVGKSLRSLVRTGIRVDLRTVDLVEDDEDSTSLEALPLFFDRCTVAVDKSTATVTFSFSSSDPNPSTWSVSEPAGNVVFDNNRWVNSRSRAVATVDIGRRSIPSVFDVVWTDSAGSYSGTWVANIEDTDGLPPPDELKGLSADLLLSALASTRPLAAAIEEQVRRQEARTAEDLLDPLRQYDSSGLLLYRTRARSAALWEMKARLSARSRSVEVLRSRLYGVIGPITIVRKIVEELTDGEVGVPSASRAELQFLVAEIALTIGTVDWRSSTVGLDTDAVKRTLTTALSDLQTICPAADSESQLSSYVVQAFEEARSLCGN